MDYRIEVEYKVRRVVYVYAETREQAKQLAQDTTEWVDALDPNELVGHHDKIRVVSVKTER